MGLFSYVEMYFNVLIIFKVLAEKVHMRALTIAQRVKLLQQGLNDRSGKRL